MEYQNEPSKPQSKLVDVTPETAEKVAREVAFHSGIFEPDDKLEVKTDDVEYGDLQVSSGRCHMFFTYVKD